MTDSHPKDESASALPVSSHNWILSWVRPYVGMLLLAAFGLLVTGAISLVIPTVAGRVVDAALVDRDVSALQTIILGLLGLFLVSAAFTFVQTYVLQSVGARILRALRSQLHAHLLTLSPTFFERERVGGLLSRLSSDVAVVGQLLTNDLLSVAQKLLTAVGSIVLLLAMHTQLTFVMLLSVPPVAIAAVLFGRVFRRIASHRQNAVAAATTAAEESLAGIATVQALGCEQREHARYRGRLDELLGISLRAARYSGVYGAGTSFCAFTALTLVLWYGGVLVADGDLTAGQLTSFLLYTGTVATSFGALASHWAGYRSALGATDRVRQLLAEQPTVRDPEDPRPLANVNGSIEFKNVQFAYPTNPDQPAITDMTFRAEPGEMIALVGPSGSGKSTAIALLFRFHEPDAGSIHLDGHDIREYSVSDLRAAIGLVPQDVFLFGGTIAENLRYGHADATLEDLVEATKASQAHQFISALPDGYDTIVGERGVRLSAGEPQRIAIARTLLRACPITVLDEATSALDAESEHEVQLAFDELARGRTSIVIAHRLSTVVRADRVVVLEDGHVRAQGTHEELLTTCELYRRYCELQLLAEDDMPPAANRPTFRDDARQTAGS